MAAPRLRIASYNIRKCIGLDRRRNPERTLAVLCELDADIIALQEADRRVGTRASAIPPELLAAHSPYEPVSLNSRALSLGWHGNAILLRRGLRALHSDRIVLPTLEPRGAVLADIAISGHVVRIIGMHLDLSGLRRHSQARAILQASAGPASVPTVLVGDCNAWRRGAASMRALARHFMLAETGPSFPTRRPFAELDRIFHSHHLQLAGCGVHASPLAQRASDHLPVWADFTLQG